MRLNELFYSIQGESSSVGLPTIFVRFTGCNLRCTYCDTKYSYDEGTAVTPEQIMRSMQNYPVRRVCITGGEPLIQPRNEMQCLLDLLAEKEYEVSIETDGSIDVDKFRLHPNQRFVIDMKVPSSAMTHKMDFNNLRRIQPERDEIKFVIGNREDYEWSKQIVSDYGLWSKDGYKVLFSPIWGDIEFHDLVDWILQDGLDVRFQLQVHKIVWDPQMRGV